MNKQSIQKHLKAGPFLALPYFSEEPVLRFDKSKRTNGARFKESKMTLPADLPSITASDINNAARA